MPSYKQMDLVIKHLKLNQYIYKSDYFKIPDLAGIAKKTSFSRWKNFKAKPYINQSFCLVFPLHFKFPKSLQPFIKFFRVKPDRQNISSNSIFQIGTLRSGEGKFLLWSCWNQLKKTVLLCWVGLEIIIRSPWRIVATFSYFSFFSLKSKQSETTSWVSPIVSSREIKKKKKKKCSQFKDFVTYF